MKGESCSGEGDEWAAAASDPKTESRSRSVHGIATTLRQGHNNASGVLKALQQARSLIGAAPDGLLGYAGAIPLTPISRSFASSCIRALPTTQRPGRAQIRVAR